MAERSRAPSKAVAKAPTGIAGLDEITLGGLPAGRPTLVCGGPGCGKTVLAMEFLVRGATRFGEPGLFVSFEELPEDMRQNFRSLDFELDSLLEQRKIHLSHVALAPGELLEAGEFSLEGLFIRLERSLSQTGSKRLVLDTLGGLFSSLSDDALVRAELARLFRWLKARGVTTIVTAERGTRQLTRDRLEDYVSDCMLLLDHRVSGNIAKRRLRIVKYRGSTHGADEYPFLIGEAGLSVFPITAVALDHVASSERVSSGVDDLDSMLGEQGYYRGSNVLISGAAGTGKSTLAAAFAQRACERGERCLYLAFEESASQIVRNMRSVGIDLAPHLECGQLIVQALRPTLFGLEEHLVAMFDAIREASPEAVVIDPISNFTSVGAAGEVKSMLVRLLDHLRASAITSVATSLTSGTAAAETTDAEVSSLMDTWIVLRQQLVGRRRRRSLYIAKSRGMDNSQELKTLVLSAHGVSLSALEGDAGRAQDGPLS